MCTFDHRQLVQLGSNDRSDTDRQLVQLDSNDRSDTDSQLVQLGSNDQFDSDHMNSMHRHHFEFGRLEGHLVAEIEWHKLALFVKKINYESNKDSSSKIYLKTSLN